MVQTYINDPLVHDKFKLGFGKAMIGVIAWTLAHAGEFSLPPLLQYGKKDTRPSRPAVPNSPRR